MNEQLIIMRHAHAKNGGQDFDRPLSEHGREQAFLMGEKLKKVILPAMIWCSSALRTRETLEGINHSLQIPEERIFFREEMYNASVAIHYNLIKEFDGNAPLMVLAHNPGVSELVEAFSKEAPFHMEPATIAIIKANSFNELEPSGKHESMILSPNS